MSSYFGTSVNESPTLVFPVGERLEGARGIALMVKDGYLVKPRAGTNAIGISLIETDEVVEQGRDITIQIKDIGKWVAGEEIVIGAELTTDAQGRAVAAKSGDFITAIALSSASKAGTWLQVQIIKAGYQPADSIKEENKEGGNGE